MTTQANKKILECGKIYNKKQLQELGNLEYIKTDKYLSGTTIEMVNPVHVYRMNINNIKVTFETIDHENFQCLQSV